MEPIKVANQFIVKSLRVIGPAILLITLIMQQPVNAQNVPSASPTPAAFLGAVTNATANGAYIGQIVAGSPAEKAGLLVGDVIESVNGISVTYDVPLNVLLKTYPPGATVQLVVGRGAGGGWLPIQVTLSVRQSIATALLNPTAAIAPVTVPARAPGATLAVPNNTGFLGIGLINAGSGLQIAKVAAGSPAEAAGIQIDDVLISIDGQPMTSVPQVQATLAAKLPGTRIAIVFTRNKQSMTVSTTLSSVPETKPTPVLGSNSATISPGAASSLAPGAQSDIVPTVVSNATVHLGVTYDVLTPALAAAKQLPVPDGAYIVTVDSGSPAEVAGLHIGDIVTSVDGDKVDAKHTLAIRLVAYNAGDTFKLNIIRGTQILTLTVTLTTRGTA